MYHRKVGGKVGFWSCVHKRQCYYKRVFHPVSLFSLTSGETDFLAFVCRGGDKIGKPEWCSGESAAGQPAPAKQRIYCHGKAASLLFCLWRTHIDTQISDKKRKSLIRASCFLLNFVQIFISLTLPLLSVCAPPSDKGEHMSDWQSDLELEACI